MKYRYDNLESKPEIQETKKSPKPKTVKRGQKNPRRPPTTAKGSLPKKR